MKRVWKQDLRDLIARYYSEFLDPEHKPINDTIEGHGEIQIDINSVYINIYNIKSKCFNQDQIAMRDFSKKLEAVTCGNLKVTNSDSSCIDIANSYEVAELN